MRYILRSFRLSVVLEAAAGVLISVISSPGQAIPESIIPADRLAKWIPGITVGVPGGIPERGTVFTNLTTIDSTGATDVSAQISAALSSCPTGAVVYVPAGTYKLSSFVTLPLNKNGVTLRGAGMGKTIFLSYLTTGYATFVAGSSEWPRPPSSIQIRGGAIAGSTNVTVDSTAELIVGRMVRIGQENPSYVFTTNGRTNDVQTTMHLVTAKSKSSVTFWPPLPLALTNSPAIAVYPTSLLESVGFEDFSVNLTNSSIGAFWVQQSWGCWLKGIEIVGSNTRQMLLQGFNMGEVRDCYIRASRSSGPDHEGIDLYGDACWNLVEDNLAVHAGFPSIILGDGDGGCSGNVIGYNCVIGVDSGSDVAGAAFSVNHGPHNMFNLFEGNIGQMFQSDGYFGSASHNTLFRNYFTADYADSIYCARAVDLCRWSYFFNVVGNVLGLAGITNYSTEANGYWGKVIYRFGYPNMGNMGFTGTNPPSSDAGCLDLNVKSNALLVANYDFATKQTINPASSLPASLYYQSKPTWWGSSSWPPFGPDLAPKVGAIPAQNLSQGITKLNGVDAPTRLRIISGDR